MNSGHGLWSAVWAITVGHLAAAQAQEGRVGPGLWDTPRCDVGAPPEGNHVVNTKGNTWPGGIVPYRFNTNVTAQNQQRAVDAMAVIEAVCNVDFIPWSTQTAYLYIHAVASGNNSCIGYSGGVCNVNISDWENHGIILHELGHSLGLYHEHQRADRDSYIQINTSSICGGTGGILNLLGTPFETYDFESVMHYSRRSYSRDGSETISVLPAYSEWKHYCGHHSYLSNGDIWVLTDLYGGPRPPRTFTLVSPAHRAQVGTGWVPSFQWGAAALADSYHLQVDDDPYFTSPEIDVSVGGTSYVALVPLPAGYAYHWRVTAENATGQTEARPRPVYTFLTESSTPSVIYVDDSAAPGGTGATWATALADLGDALAIADCSAGQAVEIRVGQGVYKPDRATGDRTRTFRLAGGTQVRGGYAGVGAANPDDRDPLLYPTVLTGDLAGDDQPAFVNYGDNSRHVVSAMAISTACTLDGLTITAGNADQLTSDLDDTGGGVFSRDSHVILKDCRVTLCSAYLAGGGVLSVDDGSIEASGTLFENNRTTWPFSGGGAGAGLNAAGGTSVTLLGCTFRANTGFQAPGVNIQDVGSSLVRDCLFEENVATQWVGALQVYRRHILVVDRCTFRGNKALSGSEGYAGAFGNYGLTGCGVGCVSTLTNCLFVENDAAWTGGAINNDDGGTVNVVNCTIVGNTAASGRGGGIANTADYGAGSVMTIANTIVRANTGGQIVNMGATTVTTATWSNVEGGFDGVGNIQSDPLFVGSPVNPYTLGPSSPCIDAANNTLVPAGITIDLDGSPRFRDDPWIANTGVPGGAGGPLIADMGAYERQDSSCYADCNADGALTVADFGCFQTIFVVGGPYADCNASGSLTVSDFGCFQTSFVTGCP